MNGKQLTKFYSKQSDIWLSDKITELETKKSSESELLSDFYRSQIFVAKRVLKDRGVTV